jgi:NAD-dependent dihydropyrimidine dehydrogenase PreA subunit
MNVHRQTFTVFPLHTFGIKTQRVILDEMFCGNKIRLLRLYCEKCMNQRRVYGWIVKSKGNEIVFCDTIQCHVCSVTEHINRRVRGNQN